MVKLGIGCIMLWGFVSLVETGKLIKVEWRMDRAKSILILEIKLAKGYRSIVFSSSMHVATIVRLMYMYVSMA